jgi:hypothetical protein
MGRACCSPCPCVPQVDVDSVVWLRSLHGSPQAAYIYARVRMSPTYVSGSIFDIPPVKPCRRRRHFSPRMRINRFVFLNLPAPQPRGPSWRKGFASIPFTCGLRHPASWRQVTAAWAHTLSQQRARQSLFLRLLSHEHSSNIHPGPSGTRRTVGTVTETEFGRTKIRKASLGSGCGGGSPRQERFHSEDAERTTGCEMALDVKSVVDGGVKRQEALG